MAQPLRIGKIARSADGLRLTAMVDGSEVFFESDDVPLVPAPEALAGAMLLPALQTRRPLVVDDALEAGWLDNAEKLSAIFGKWWDYPCQSPIVRGEVVPVAAKGPTGPASSIACFTAGVDSFHLQLKGDHPTDSLLFVHGFDVHLGDTDLFRRVRESLIAVAEATGKRLLILRSNLSQHPTFKLVSWDRGHAAALGAAAQILSGVAGTFVIPSSFSIDENMVCGSHWQTDPLWSSSRVQVVVGDAKLTRTDKIFALANEPLVQHHLRVCFNRATGKYNCSRCAKCLRTMTILMAAKSLHQFTVFDQTVPMAKCIDGINYLDVPSLKRFGLLVNADVPRDVQEAWRGMIRRTRERYFPSLPRRIVRRIRRAIKE